MGHEVTEDRPDWAPLGIDMTRPSPARMYDYYLGGSHNFAVDRQAAGQVVAVFPDIVESMRQNRAFLRRVVRFLVDAGVRQFLDIGSGIPTAGNVHEVAQQIEPSCRVLYVDYDPVAVTHATAVLRNNPLATAIEADARDTDALIRRIRAEGLLDLDQPVGVLMMAVVHFISDSDDPAGVVARFRDGVASGSYLAMSHGRLSTNPVEAEGIDTALAIYRNTPFPLTFRTHEQISTFFAGWNMLEPGLVPIPRWRPETDTSGVVERVPGYAGVGRKP